ncbi:hypothetical protein TRIATDRAFT_90783 [Trichoderma atroviride IMI 206040]|uniref:C2H2-type domain-containing protein n=1 Tax=Hypocrea atroviridis (strain ATCC 20476 / IMI 206040) TaxID=452589 RepID=G9NQ46_HYPAI|nr:uncharacterized protein TRIATDRAFT_90783 [Trichoderma atroviride IMI 206040]EHK47195.1 hypothetical protein TRIATDRAFT_90783 [Trichoderma atroviride IMI 206040]
MDSFGASFFPDSAPAGPLGTNIRAIALHCRALLRECSKLPSLKEDEWAENRLAEFNLWAANSGVFGGDRNGDFPAVNDERKPQDSSEEEDEADKQDAELEVGESGDKPESPEHGRLASPEDIPRAFSPWSDDSDSSTDSDQDSRDACSPVITSSSLDGPKVDVAQVIDHLARLTLAIRKAGSSSRTHKADRRFNADHQPAFRRHLNVVVLARGMEAGRSDHAINPNNLTATQDRLIIANLRRRNRFLYAQRHARKLAAEAEPQNAPQEYQLQDDVPIMMEDHGEPEPEEDIIAELEEQASDPVETPAQVVVETGLEPVVETQPPILSATSASGMTQAIDPGLVHNVTPSQVAKTEITTTSAKIAYPKPPAMPLGMRHFKCPCCCQTLPEMYRQPSLWKKHLMTDIAPYTCIIDDCPTPDRLFVTRAEWDQHTRNDHQKCWQCLPCTTVGKAPLVFPSVEAFMEHLGVAHSDTINEEQYSTLIPESAIPVPAGISCCPLCNSNGPADSPALLNHIAEHLHSFALRSLPWPGRESLHTNLDEQDDDDDDPDDLDDGDHDAYNYFLHNDYFDQGSEVASRQYNLTSGSNRDSDGLPSLHSSQASERPATPSDKGSEVADDASQTADYDPMVEPGEPRPVIEASYDESRGTPIELVPSADSLPEVVQGPIRMPDLVRGPREIYEQGVLINLASLLAPMAFGNWRRELGYAQDILPEVVEGEWPQKCAQRFPRDTDDPEVTRPRELMLICMQIKYKRKAEKKGPDSQPSNPSLPYRAYYSPRGFLARVAELEDQGNLKDAILWQTDAVNHFRNELGDAHYYFIENVDKLAEMRWDAWNKENADAFLSKEVEIFIDNVGTGDVQDPVWIIDGAYNLATVCAKYRLSSLGKKLFNRLIDAFEQESKLLEDGIQHTKAAREKYSDFLKDQNLWEEVVVMERNSLACLNADPHLELDITEALSRLAHALHTWIFLAMLSVLLRSWLSVAKKIWGERDLASIGTVKELTDYYSILFEWEKAAQARDLYNWLKVKDPDVDLVKETTPHLDLGPEDLDERAPRLYARPNMAAAGLPISELVDTTLDHDNSAPPGPAKGTSGNTVNAGIHAKFLSFAGTSINFANNAHVVESFDIDTLETRRLKREPQDDDEDLLARLQEPKVQAAIRGGLYGARPIYIISGLKIARGLSVQREESKSTHRSMGGTVPIIEGISVGAGMGGEKRFGTSSTFKVAPEEDIILAYQVHKIKPKSRKVTKASVNVYETSSAFLHGDDENSGFKGVEVVSVSADSLLSEDEDDDDGEKDEAEGQYLELKGGNDGEYYVYMGQS